MSNGTVENRKRAWFFIKVDPPSNAEGIANNIYINFIKDRDYVNQNADNFLIIRADVASGCSLFDIVVPVDAKHDFSLEEIKTILFDATPKEGVAISIAEVTKHSPITPHETYGYVSSEELQQGRLDGVDEKDPDKAGLQRPWSPGANKWG